METKIIRIYIASPYTKGNKVFNVKNSLEIADKLIKTNKFVPFCPLLTHFHHMFFPQSYETWLKFDFIWIGQCQCLLRLPGESLGADREVEEANKLNIPVFYTLEGLFKYYQI